MLVSVEDLDLHMLKTSAQEAYNYFGSIILLAV